MKCTSEDAKRKRCLQDGSVGLCKGEYCMAWVWLSSNKTLGKCGLLLKSNLYLYD